MTQGYFWEIEEINDTDYKIILTYNCADRILKMIWNSTKSKLERKLNIKLQDDILEEWSIPPTMKSNLKVVENAVKKHFKALIKEAKKDGFKIINGEVKEVLYQKLKTGDLKVIVEIRGLFIKEKC